MYYKGVEKLEGVCTKCGRSERAKGQRWCKECRAEYMREWRKSHPLTEEQSKKDNCRSYAGVYLRRGKIERGNCIFCEKPGEEMHHEDYDKPLSIVWLCRDCHVKYHTAL